MIFRFIIVLEVVLLIQSLAEKPLQHTPIETDEEDDEGKGAWYALTRINKLEIQSIYQIIHSLTSSLSDMFNCNPSSRSYFLPII